jgi:hypothetical protein
MSEPSLARGSSSLGSLDRATAPEQRNAGDATARSSLRRIARGPDALTAHFAAGGGLDGQESEWVAQHLTQLRASAVSDGAPAVDLSLNDLKHVYMSARVIHGSVLASQLALPAVIEAGETVRTARLPEDLASFARHGAAQTELFLSGARQGRAYAGNDYPVVVKDAIAAIAGILNGPYERACEQCRATRPELWELALAADELQRLCWGHMRWRINEVVPAEELATYRSKPLQQGTDELLALIKERTGVALPPRILQRDGQDYIDPRDDWLAALQHARQDPRLAVLCGIRFSVENAEIATLYCLGSLLMRVHQGEATATVLDQQIRFGVQDIAWGSRLVTHNARFQSRIGARPNYRRSFAEFLRNVRKQIATSPVQPDGQIDWFDTHAPQIRGWCPAQNLYDVQPADDAGGFAQQGREAVAAWTAYAQRHFGVSPVYSEPSAVQLLASVVLFTILHEGSPMRPESDLVEHLADEL